MSLKKVSISLLKYYMNTEEKQLHMITICSNRCREQLGGCVSVWVCGFGGWVPFCDQLAKLEVVHPVSTSPARQTLQPRSRHTSDSIKVKCRIKWKIQQSVPQSFHASQPNLNLSKSESPKTRHSALIEPF